MSYCTKCDHLEEYHDENGHCTMPIGTRWQGRGYCDCGASPVVPRVARSLDDLRIGQIVAWYETSSSGVNYVYGSKVQAVTDWVESDIEKPLFILSDPPPEPKVLSPKAQELFYLLEEAVKKVRLDWRTSQQNQLLTTAENLIEEMKKL